jgi:hypothetical protein
MRSLKQNKMIHVTTQITYTLHVLFSSAQLSSAQLNFHNVSIFLTCIYKSHI